MRPTRRSVLAGASSAAVVRPNAMRIKHPSRETLRENGFLFTHGDIVHPVYRLGEGPGVLLLHEMPGMVPEFWRLAGWLQDAGFCVYIPDLYADSFEKTVEPSITAGALKSCLSREIHLFAANASSPLTVWLRALANHMNEQTGEKGVGVIGLCMTGNFALSLVMEPAVIAPVASEPSLPLTISAAGHAALHLSAEERQALRERETIDVMALRFEGDPVCRKARFDALEDLVGSDRLTRIELPDSAQNPAGNSFPHAVLTKDLIDEEGSLTRQALDQVLEFLTKRLAR